MKAPDGRRRRTSPALGAVAAAALVLLLAALPAARAADPVIRVLSPAPSAQLVRSFTYNVTWQVDNELPSSSYDVDVFRDGVSGDAPSLQLATSAAPTPVFGERATSNGTYVGPVVYRILWTVTNSVTPGRYTVRARLANNNWLSGTSALFDVVAGVMSIESLPDAVVGGTVQTVRWSSAGQTPPVSLELRRLRLGLVRTLAANLSSGRDSFQWEVPLTLVGPAFYIKATAATDESMTASTPQFSIAQGRIYSRIMQNATALRPLGVYTVAWYSEGTVLNVSVALFDSGGQRTLLAGADPSGTLDFQVPLTATGAIYAAVCSPLCSRATLGGGAEAALSQYVNVTAVTSASESVVIPAEVGLPVYGTVVVVTSPSGREQWVSGTTQTIVWRCEAAYPFFDIVLVDPQLGGARLQTIASRVAFTPPLGAVDWPVPVGMERGDRYGVVAAPSDGLGANATGLVSIVFGPQSFVGPDVPLISGTSVSSFVVLCCVVALLLYFLWWRRRKAPGDGASEAATSARTMRGASPLRFLYSIKPKSMARLISRNKSFAAEKSDKPPGPFARVLCFCCIAAERRRVAREEAALAAERAKNAAAVAAANAPSGGGGDRIASRSSVRRAPAGGLQRSASRKSSVGSDGTAVSAVESVSQLRLPREEGDEDDGEGGSPSVWGAARKYLAGGESEASGDEGGPGPPPAPAVIQAGRYVNGVYHGGYVSRGGGQAMAAPAPPAAVQAAALAAAAGPRRAPLDRQLSRSRLEGVSIPSNPVLQPAALGGGRRPGSGPGPPLPPLPGWPVRREDA